VVQPAQVGLPAAKVLILELVLAHHPVAVEVQEAFLH
jgi:hypothetical protein